MSNLSASLVVLAVVAACASQALAHAALLSADPAPNSTIAAPKAFKLTFSEKVVPAFSGFQLVMESGKDVEVKAEVSRDGKTMTGTPKASLKPGTYKLSWHAASVEDGHRTESSYSFKVK